MKSYRLLVIFLLIVGWVWLFPRKEETVWIDHGKEPLTLIKIELSGAFEFPGVYHVFEPITVIEALRFGGRLSDDANTSHLNYSELITKDRQIIVLALGDKPVETWVKLNINKASFKELLAVPGLTETRAASIILYREAHGDFKHLDELLNVKYIGVATLEKIKPYLTL
jgi:competence protein ComEA